jgi:hypothetical protein
MIKDMRPFSRTLPKGGSYLPPHPYQNTFALALLCGLGYAVLRSFLEWGTNAAIGYLLFAVILLILIWPSHYFTERKLKALISARSDDSICTFARSFDRRSVDPWVIRAVWNELQICMNRKEGPFPIRASDNLWKDLLIDEDDIAMDMIKYLPPLIGRSIETMEENPYYGCVQTVEDLVLFFNALPLDPTALHPHGA